MEEVDNVIVTSERVRVEEPVSPSACKAMLYQIELRPKLPRRPHNELGVHRRS